MARAPSGCANCTLYAGSDPRRRGRRVLAGGGAIRESLAAFLETRGGAPRRASRILRLLHSLRSLRPCGCPAHPAGLVGWNDCYATLKTSSHHRQADHQFGIAEDDPPRVMLPKNACGLVV